MNRRRRPGGQDDLTKAAHEVILRGLKRELLTNGRTHPTIDYMHKRQCSLPDIYYTRLHPVLGWLPPKPLSCDVSSGAEEWSPSLVECEGETILFFSSTRSGTQKIYSSTLSQNGDWGPAVPVDELNLAGAQDARQTSERMGWKWSSIRLAVGEHLISIRPQDQASLTLGPHRCPWGRTSIRHLLNPGPHYRATENGSTLDLGEQTKPVTLVATCLFRNDPGREIHKDREIIR
jgi:hypothetical protein